MHTKINVHTIEHMNTDTLARALAKKDGEKHDGLFETEFDG